MNNETRILLQNQLDTIVEMQQPHCRYRAIVVKMGEKPVRDISHLNDHVAKYK